MVVRGFGEFSEIDVLTFDGLSYTRIIQPLPVSVPLDEFVAWVAKNGGSLGPLELAHDEPGVELQLHTFDRPPESLRMSEPPAPDPIHRKPTLKLSAVRVPKEAYRPDGPPPPASPTQKLPQVKSPPSPGLPATTWTRAGSDTKAQRRDGHCPSRRERTSAEAQASSLFASAFFSAFFLAGSGAAFASTSSTTAMGALSPRR